MNQSLLGRLGSIIALAVCLMVNPLPAAASDLTPVSRSQACAQVEQFHLEMQLNFNAARIVALCNGEPWVAPTSNGRTRRTQPAPGVPYGASDIDLITGGEGAYPNVTQSGGQVWAHGSTVIAAYNDSRGRNASPICIAGGSRSTDGGATWANTHPFCGDSAANFGYPALAYDAAHAKWLAVFISAACGGAGLGLWASTNDGVTWSRTGCAHSGPSDDRESMWVDNNPSSPFYGRTYVSWNDFNVGGGALRSTFSTDGGATWSLPTNVFASFRRDVQVTTSTGTEGLVYIAAMDEGGGGLVNNRQNHVYRSTDGGATWSGTTVGGPFPGPGRALCSSNSYFPGMYTTPTAGYWRHMGWGDIGAGPSGVVHYTYASRNTGNGDPGNVFYTRSTDTGFTWSAPLQLNTDAGTRGQWEPSLAVTPGGEVFASWYDERNTTGETGYERYGRLSTDNGVTWQADSAVSDGVITKPLQVDPGINACWAGDYDRSYGDTGVVHTIWTDGRVAINGNPQQDVFYDQQFVSPATVTSVSPVIGPTGGGQTVTITGNGFNHVNWVSFGATPAAMFTVNSPTKITAVTPAHAAGAVHVFVNTPAGTSAATGADVYTFSTAPFVSSVSPNIGPASGGQSVTITGANFSSVHWVSFGGTAAASFTVNSPTKITAVSPARAAGTIHVRVNTAAGTSGATAADLYTYTSAPGITSISPRAGPPGGGQSVTINGFNFTNVHWVSFGGVAAPSFTVNSPTKITAVSPAHAAGAIHVRVNTGATTPATAADLYYFESAPTITSVSPRAGPLGGGQSVIITGTNFGATNWVSFGGVAAPSFTVNSLTKITAVTPAHAGAVVHVRVNTPLGTSAITNADKYAYEGAPTITSVSPHIGPAGGGQSVTITGNNLFGANWVSFGGVAAPSFTVNSPTKITAVTPAHAGGVVHVRVNTPLGTSATTNADLYTFVVPHYTITTQTGQSIVPGVTDIGNHGDDAVTTIALPFPVYIYGTPFTSATVTSNGTIQFNTTDSTFTNVCLPWASHGRAFFPYWDDLRTDDTTGLTGRGIYTTVTGSAPNRTFYIEWRAKYFANTALEANFEFVYNEADQVLRTIYGQVANGGSSSTEGVQDAVGGAFDQYGCNGAGGAISSGLAVTYTP